MQIFQKSILFYIFSLILCLDLFSRTEEISFSRNDASQATAYVSLPEKSEFFPLVVYIDGSPMQSVQNNFSVLSFLFDQKNIGVIAIEKRGITKNEVNLEEFLAYDCYENRLQDYIQLISELNAKITHWNGQLIFIGSSEGGKIAPKLTLLFSDKTVATILIGAGGGLSFGEEIKYQIKQIAMENDGNAFNENELDKKIEDKYETILNNPNSLQKYYDKTYQWFASYLKYHPLEDLVWINTPLLIIHGALDTHIPVESSDLVKTAFDTLEKDNLTYFRVEDMGHSISKRMDIFMLLLNFSSEHSVSAPHADLQTINEKAA